jgi:hypothetical protein
VLVDGAIDVAPLAADFHVGLIDSPTITDRVSTGPCVDQQRGETLDPAVDGHVIDVDASLGEEFFDVAVRQPEVQVPPDSQDHGLGREPETRERRHRQTQRSTTARVSHPPSLTPRRSLNATVPVKVMVPLLPDDRAATISSFVGGPRSAIL